MSSSLVFFQAFKFCNASYVMIIYDGFGVWYTSTSFPVASYVVCGAYGYLPSKGKCLAVFLSLLFEGLYASCSYVHVWHSVTQSQAVNNLSCIMCCGRKVIVNSTTTENLVSYQIACTISKCRVSYQIECTNSKCRYQLHF